MVNVTDQLRTTIFRDKLTTAAVSNLKLASTAVI